MLVSFDDLFIDVLRNFAQLTCVLFHSFRTLPYIDSVLRMWRWLDTGFAAWCPHCSTNKGGIAMQLSAGGQLAHAERDEIRAAYNYAEYQPERRKMMQAWANYLDKLAAGAKIVSIRPAQVA